MEDRRFQVQGLGEIAIRCNDMAAMVAFYRDTIGLELLSGGHRAGITFFKINTGVGGHTTVLALFHKAAGNPAMHEQGHEAPVTDARSSLHHLALTLPYAEQDAVIAWYDAKGLDYTVQVFDWIGWRGIFTRDPEGNTVELVAKDPDWTPPTPA